MSALRDEATGTFMPRNLVVLSTICLTICIESSANASCINLKQKDPLSFQATLNYRIFPGSPNYEDVRKGDTPEPTYILKLDNPICATGDEFVDQNTKPLRRYGEIFGALLGNESLLRVLEHSDAIRGITMLL
jgi:hypothetical protein